MLDGVVRVYVYLGVDVLVELVEEGDCLDDHIVGAVHVELDLCARVGVAETKLGLSNVYNME